VACFETYLGTPTAVGRGHERETAVSRSHEKGTIL
jgi:hypothetical protein